jgi:hypothetical protein
MTETREDALSLLPVIDLKKARPILDYSLIFDSLTEKQDNARLPLLKLITALRYNGEYSTASTLAHQHRIVEQNLSTKDQYVFSKFH